MSAVAQENEYDDEIELVLAYHKGDARAAIEALLKDRDFLVKEVAIGSMAVSHGYTRGWKPTVFVK
ncbi:MAG TPA: hypothetical protein DFK19_09760 [Ochrobactrum sp.]|nr:hypothetical protein [Ochrobactrum sp.]